MPLSQKCWNTLCKFKVPELNCFYCYAAGVSLKEKLISVDVQESSDPILESVSTSILHAAGEPSVDIPEPPEVSAIVESVSKIVLNAAGEPTFESLGLGGWTPSGIVQQCMEFLHISAGMPWWTAILAG